MKGFKLRKAFCLLMCFLIVPQMSYAGRRLKESIQQKINASRNIQFQQNTGQTWGGSQSSTYANQNDNASNEEVAQRGEPCTCNRIINDRESVNPVQSSYAIYQTDYKAGLEENVVTIKGKAVFQIFQKGWTKLPLAKTDVGLIDVSVNRGAAFVTMQNNMYYLMIDKPGRYTMNIEFLIKAQRERENGPGSFSFDVMSAPISQYEFEMPEKEVQIFVEPAIRVEIKEEADKTTAWAIMPNTRKISTRWTQALPKEEISPAKLEPKLYAETATQASIGEGIIRCYANIKYSILQSEVSVFRLSLPKDVSLLDVDGKDLRDWKIKKEKDVQYLDVYLNFGIKGKFEIKLKYERNIGEGSVVANIPTVKALGVERENGFVGVGAKTNVELAVNKLERVTLIDVKQLPRDIWGSSGSPILLAFKYLNHPFDITIDVTRHEELPVLIAAVDSANYVTLYTEEGKILTKATYHVRNNVKQFLHLALPEGAKLWSAFVAGKPVKPAKAENKDKVLIPLEKSRIEGETLKRFPVEIVYLNSAKKMGWLGGLKLTLPEADIPSSEIFWSVYTPYDYHYFNFGGDVKRVERHSRGRIGFVRRGVQGRMRQAASDLMQSTTQYESSYLGTKSAGKFVPAERKGALPIKITVPQQGHLERFSKLLVVEGEAPSVRMSFVVIPSQVRWAVKLLIFIAAMFFIGKYLSNRKKRKKAAKEQANQEK
ncbi:MAG: hypothetical protein KAR05_10045 [Candidatus Omnitrophica bacterium]|nr:hypothetical protein [Candidatus Omnitrophota bacterium]